MLWPRWHLSRGSVQALLVGELAVIGIVVASVSTSLINNPKVLPVSSGVIEPEPTTKLPFERRKVIAPLNSVASFPNGKGLVDKDVDLGHGPAMDPGKMILCFGFPSPDCCIANGAHFMAGRA